MACEMFVLGNRDFRLPGLALFFNGGEPCNTRAILWGVAAMIAVIVLLDQLVGGPSSFGGQVQVRADREFRAAHSLCSIYRPRFHRAAFVSPYPSACLHWLTLTFTLGARRAAETLSAPKQNASCAAGSAICSPQVFSSFGFAVFHRPANCPLFTARTMTSSGKRRADFSARQHGAHPRRALDIPVGVASVRIPLARIAQPLVQMAASFRQPPSFRLFFSFCFASAEA